MKINFTKKPNFWHIASVARNKNVNDYEILMIGDSSHDFEVAKLLNIKCILFANGHYSKKRLIKNDCLIIDDHLDLKLILG